MSAKVSREELSKNYKKAPRNDEKPEEAPKNELRVGPLRTPKTYISAAIDLLEGDEKTVVVKGRGKAVSAVVNIVEVVKRRVKGLHQLSEMESIEVVDVYEPKSEEGGEKVEIKKYICGLKVILSKEELDTKAPGYQAPLPESEVTAEKKELRKPKGGKGGAGPAAGRGKAGKSGARGGGRGAGGKGGRGVARGGSRGGAAGAR